MAHAAMEVTGGGTGTNEQGSSRRSGCRCAGGSPPVAAQHQVRKEHGPRNTRLRSGLYIDNAQGAPRRDEQNPLGGDPTRDYVLSSDGRRRRNTTGGVHERPVAAAAALGRLVRRGRRPRRERQRQWQRRRRQWHTNHAQQGQGGGNGTCSRRNATGGVDERPVAAAAALGRLVRRGRRPLRERQRRWQRRKRQWHTSHAKQDQDGGTDTARPRRQGQDGGAKTAERQDDGDGVG